LENNRGGFHLGDLNMVEAELRIVRKQTRSPFEQSTGFLALRYLCLNLLAYKAVRIPMAGRVIKRDETIQMHCQIHETLETLSKGSVGWHPASISGSFTTQVQT
jgi:hypothetical protein